MAARMAIAENSAQAAAVLVKAWGKCAPHPDLAAAFAEIASMTPAPDHPVQTPLKQHPDSRETKPTELQIAATDFTAARKVMGTLGQRMNLMRAA